MAEIQPKDSQLDTTTYDIQKFKEKPVEERRERLAKLLEKNPNKIPIIFEKHSLSRLTEGHSLKYMSTRHLRLSYFANQIRNSLKLTSENALFFSCSNMKIIKHDILIGDLYDTSKDFDGFLYIQYREVESFGS
jgi:microtubule-associated protein 1 light chain